MEKIPHGSARNGTPPPAKKDAASFNEMPLTREPTANAPMVASLVVGTTRRPIVLSLPEIRSLFPIGVWRDALCIHPDCDFVNELLQDINFGVRIGFNHDRTPLISSNHPFSAANPAPVAQELERELSLNRKAGPFLVPPFLNFVCSPMGAIPKKHSQHSKWRIINDLSWPAGMSVNDAISRELYTCSYDSPDQAISYL